MKNFLIVCMMIFITAAAPPRLPAATPEESFRKSYPNIHADNIRPSAVKGLYEIASGSSIFYYVPGLEYLISGEMYTKDGRNLTKERRLEILTRNLKEVPLEKAVKIGSGPHTVIEITDPDCSFCRQASAYLTGRDDLTRYVYLFPLSIHPNAEPKARYILCAENRARAYEEAMTGKLDDMKFKPCEDPAALDLLNAHREIVSKIGVTGTPLFFIDGQVVEGANIKLMEKILGEKK
jgi:thiol:disulfide interchange protein DsbC